MGSMPAADWKQWAIDDPNLVQVPLSLRFINLGGKCKEALNVEAAEPSMSKPKKMTPPARKASEA
jgi:hypothetical protein